EDVVGMSAVTDRSPAVMGGASSAMYLLDSVRLVTGVASEVRRSAPLRGVLGSHLGLLAIALVSASAQYPPTARCGGYNRPSCLRRIATYPGLRPCHRWRGLCCVRRPIVPKNLRVSDDATP